MKLKVIQVSESAFSVKGHGVHTAFVETVNAVRKQPNINTLVNSSQSADIRHIHTVGLYSLVQLLFRDGKKVVSAHIVPDSLIGSLRFAKSWAWLAKLYLRFFYNHADAVIAVSDDTKNDLLRLGVKAPVYVIYNMIDTTRYARNDRSRSEARHNLGLDEKSWIVASNGQVQPRKRVDTFIRLAKELPDMHFVWIGGIPFKGAAANYEKMKKLMVTAPKNVTFTGVIDLEKVCEYLHASDVFAMLSEQETFGLAIVEAAASGLPVVLRDISDYDKTFRPYGVMCGEDDFAGKLRQLKDDKAFYEKMLASAEKLANTYDSETVTRELVKLYEELSGDVKFLAR